MVVEMVGGDPPQHHTLSPASPVSVLHNSPFYSPVKQSGRPASPLQSFSSPLHRIGNMNLCREDEDDVLECEPGPDIANDSDEGIESEDGEEIDGEAFKQLIKNNVTEQNIFNKSLVYAACTLDKVNCGRSNTKAVCETNVNKLLSLKLG